MKTILLLVRGDARTFYDLQGNSILASVPFKSVLLVDRGNRDGFADLPGDIEIETVRWTEQDALKQRVRELHGQHHFSAVATLDESNVALAAELREQLELPGMRLEQTAWFRDKTQMKQRLAACGMRVPLFASCADSGGVRQLLTDFGKLVIKPVDGFGSKQVAFVADADDLEAWYAEHADDAECYEAEEFVSGQLYHVNALVIAGQERLTAVAAYLPGMSNIDFSTGAPFVSHMLEEDALNRRLIEYSCQVNRALQLQDGVTHLECFVTAENEIVFCEIGLRPGGGGIVWMIESQFGINLNRAAIALAAGEAGLLPAPVRVAKRLSGLIGMRSNLSGFVEQVAEADDFRDDGIRLKHIDVKAGAFKPAAAHCTDFLGLFIFDSDDHRHFDIRWRQLYEQFHTNLTFKCV